MNKKSWYIWFSYPAFAILYTELQRKLNPDFPFVVWGRQHSKTLLRLTGHIVFSFFVIFGIPLFAMLASTDMLAIAIPSLENVIPWIRKIFIYLQGVYITYRLYKWQEKNLPKDEDIPKYNDTQ